MTDRQPLFSVCAPEMYHEVVSPIVAKLAGAGLVVEHFGDYEALRRAGGLARARIVIANACPGWALDAAPNLVAVINPVSGCDAIDRAAATRHGVIVGVGHIPENYESMAEAGIALILGAMLDLPAAERQLRQNLPPGPRRGRMLSGKTVGLIGYGKIAQGIARRLGGWDVHILISAPRLHAVLPQGGRHVPLDDLLRDSDVVVVACSLNDDTRRLLDRGKLALMKPDAVLVNIARGPIIDEQAAYEAARDGRLGFLALDVFEQEPLPEDSPLRGLPNAILTPHMLGHTIESLEAVIAMAAGNVKRVLAGEPPEIVLNPEVLPRWRGAIQGSTSAFWE